MNAAGGFDGVPVFCSWSGGKDSAMALWEAVHAGAEPRLLISMLTEGGERSRSHGLRRDVLAAQAAAIGVPIEFGAASWSGYEAELLRVFGTSLNSAGTRVGVFGDIDMQDHRDWEERVCALAGAEARMPLWQRPRWRLMDEVLGEYHSLVVDGPLFRRPLAVEAGERSLRDGVWFADLRLA